MSRRLSYAIGLTLVALLPLAVARQSSAQFSFSRILGSPNQTRTPFGSPAPKQPGMSIGGLGQSTGSGGRAAAGPKQPGPTFGNVMPLMPQAPGNQPSFYQPRPNYYYPRQNYYQQSQVQPNMVQSNVVQSNVAPATNPLPTQTVAPKTNVLPVVEVEPEANAEFVLEALSISPAQLQQMRAELERNNGKKVDELAILIPVSSTGASAEQPAPTPLNLEPAAAAQLAGAVRGGNPDAVRAAVADKGTAGASLVKQAEAFKSLNALRGKLSTGTFGIAEGEQIKGKMQEAMVTDRQQANGLLDDLVTNSRLTHLLSTAKAEQNTIPAGNGAVIVLAGGMSPGQIISLGNGAVLVGSGSGARSVQIVTGNVAHSAGMTVGIGPPVPDSKAKLVSSGTVLKNEGDSQINYLVNEGQFSMAPGFKQILPAGTTWTIKFDRGGSGGTVAYKVTEGAYRFAPAEGVWQLFKHAYKITVDNTDNPFEFRYLLNGRHWTVAAGQSLAHEEKYPPILKFDGGSGTTRRKALRGGVYRVAVAGDNTLDLFPPESVVSPGEPLPVSAISAPNLFGDSTSPPAAPPGPSLFGPSSQ